MGLVAVGGCRVSLSTHSSRARIVKRRLAEVLPRALEAFPQFSAQGGGREGKEKLVQKFWLSPCGFGFFWYVWLLEFLFLMHAKM